MNLAAVSVRLGKRLLPICFLLLACLTVPVPLKAQTTGDCRSVNRVVASLIASTGELGDEDAYGDSDPTGLGVGGAAGEWGARLGANQLYQQRKTTR